MRQPGLMETPQPGLRPTSGAALFGRASTDTMHHMLHQRLYLGTRRSAAHRGVIGLYHLYQPVACLDTGQIARPHDHPPRPARRHRSPDHYSVISRQSRNSGLCRSLMSLMLSELRCGNDCGQFRCAERGDSADRPVNRVPGSTDCEACIGSCPAAADRRPRTANPRSCHGHALSMWLRIVACPLGKRSAGASA